VTIQTKREYIALLWDLYRQARKRSDKSRLLDQICQMLEMHRKSAIRLLGKGSVPKLSRAPAPRANLVSDEVRKAIAVL
jgi:hypothetical protein